MKLVAYTRCSTDRQEDSQATQESSIREYCAAHDHNLLRVYHEVVISGSTGIERRTVLPEIFDAVKSPKRDFDGIIVVRMDRLFRNPGEEYKGLEILGKHKCKILSIYDPVDRDTATGRLIAGVMSHIRAFERELTGERIYLHNMTRAMNGRWAAGQPPLGFDYDSETKTMTANARISDAERVFAEFIHAGGNASQTARNLNALGLRTRDGNVWRDDGVLTIVKNPIYRRRLRYDNYEGDAQELIPETISQELLTGVDTILAQCMPKRTPQRSTKYAYSGLMTCSVCGSPVRSNGMRNHLSWICSLRKDSGLCTSRNVSNKYIDQLVSRAVKIILQKYSAFWSEIAIDTQPKRQRNDVADQRIRLEAKRRRTIELYTDGMIRTRSELDTKIMQIDAELALLTEDRLIPVISMDTISKWIYWCDESWSNINDELRRELLNVIGVKITLCMNPDENLWVELDNTIGVESVRVNAKYRNN